MAENDAEYVPDGNEKLIEEKDDVVNSIETERNRIVLALSNKTLFAKFPLPDDLMSHKSEAFKVFQVIYNTENIPVQNWFMCSDCQELINVVRSNGTAKMRRHRCFAKWKNQQHSVKSENTFSFDEESLASLFAKIAEISFPKGKVKSEHFRPIMPKKSTPDEW